MLALLRSEAAIFAFALQFLTRLPIPQGIIFTQERFSASVRYYPLVGLVIGAFAAAVFYAATKALPSFVAMILSTGATLLLTGAFHEDGLADTFDGIGGGTDRAKTLEIMKDSRIGTYGACALVIVLLTKIAVLTTLGISVVAPLALIAGHCLSRASSVAVIATSNYVRDHGTGKPVSSALSNASVIVIAATAACACALMLWAVQWQAITAALAALGGGHIATRALFERRLGGYTGDTLGAVQQVSEVAFYLGLVAWL